MDIERKIDPFSPKNASETQAFVIEYLRVRQEVEEMMSPYMTNVKVDLEESDFPLYVLHTGDNHLTHVDSDVDGLPNAVKSVLDHNGVLVIHSNLIDAVSNKFISTNTINVGLSLDGQVALANSVLKVLIDKERVIGVGANMCHEGWAMKTATHDPIPRIYGPTTPLLYTGGQFRLFVSGKRIGAAQVYHKPMRGGTNLSPEGGERAASRQFPVGHEERADVYIGAHYHSLTAAQDVIKDPVSRKMNMTTLGQVGTDKGSEKMPDRFLVGLGVAPNVQPADVGRGLVVIWRKNSEGNYVNYPVTGYNRANLLYESEWIWENANRLGIYDELRKEALDTDFFSGPEVTFNQEDSEFRLKDAAASSEGNAPLFKTLDYNIKTKLPLKIHFIGNIRVGSSSLDRKCLSNLLSEIDNDAWSYYFLMRRLINPRTSNSDERTRVLADFIRIFQPSKSSLLGIMLTDELRKDSWQKDIVIEKGTKDEPPVIDYGMAPGDELYYNSQLAGIPLMMPETVVLAHTQYKRTKHSKKVKAIDYTLYLRDTLSNLTSLINPYHGLSRIQQLWGIDADALIGGHTEIVGWRTWMRPWGQLEIVVPGGFAEFIEKGIGSRIDYPTGGQGVILLARQKMIFSFGSQVDGMDLHNALWLREAYDQLGRLKEIKQKLNKRLR